MSTGSTSDRGFLLRGARILTVEDDFLVSLDIATTLHDAGASAVRTCGTIEQALQMLEIETFSAAILDVRLGRATIAPVARKLTEAGTPFVFYTGQLGIESAILQWPHAPVIAKPAPTAALVAAVANVLSSSRAA
jgi:DNA-binding NtrC family response regulator